MLILGTLILTWLAHNWWKVLLLLIAVIAVHEYVLHKKAKEKAAGAEMGHEDEAGKASDAAVAEGPVEAETVDADPEAETENN